MIDIGIFLDKVLIVRDRGVNEGLSFLEFFGRVFGVVVGGVKEL